MSNDLCSLCLCRSESIDPTRERCEECHHISDKFLLWTLLFRFIEDFKSDAVVFEYVFYELETEPGYSVLMCDDESTDSCSVCQCKEFLESPPPHIES